MESAHLDSDFGTWNVETWNVETWNVGSGLWENGKWNARALNRVNFLSLFPAFPTNPKVKRGLDRRLAPFFGLFSQTSMQTVICLCHLYRFLWPLSLKVAEDERDENELNWLFSLLSLILS